MTDVPRIGVAISTHNRRDVLESSVRKWLSNRPENCEIVIIDDASSEPVPNYRGVTVVRNEFCLGIAMTKNRGIEELMNAGCDHLFLVDDDVYPIRRDWWKPYVESEEQHLSYQWPRGSRWRILHRDHEHFSISFPRGVMLYAHRDVIDVVGGFEPSHGRWGGEHVDWSHRIHQEKLSTWEFADVIGSDRYWFAHDRHSNTTNSTVPLRERVQLARYNGSQWDKERSTGSFVPYEQQATGHQDYALGPDLVKFHKGEVDSYLATLWHVLYMRPYGQALEFGVGSGRSLSLIASFMPVTGFDSFEGLPERWRDGYEQGEFACEVPDVDNATIVSGWFDDTLKNFSVPDDLGLVHIDCDLYSSTKTVLEHLEGKLKPGCYVVFDEWHGYSPDEIKEIRDGYGNVILVEEINGPEDHEQKAWKEFAERTGISWTVVGHGPEQWAIRII